MRAAARTFGLALGEVRVVDVYWLAGELEVAVAERLVAAFCDPVTEVAALAADGSVVGGSVADGDFVEVALRPGVTDAVAETLLGLASRLGFHGLEAVATGRRYEVRDAAEGGGMAALSILAERVVANRVIERAAVGVPLAAAFVSATDGGPRVVERVAVRGLDDAALEAVSRARRLALDGAEMRAIAAHFEREGREPSDLELEMLAQTWSEHCVHKTFRAVIDTVETEADGSRTFLRVDGLLKSYLRSATEALARPWVRSAFVDNAGIVALTETFDVAVKVETHNHPSALEPFGGANTGMGGVIRDVLGVSARPFANLDVLCFGGLDDDAPLPAGALHPRRIAAGVVHGIEDYGNKMGIPTVAGAVFFHPHYTTNPLVFCGTVGILPRGAHPTRIEAGDLVVVLGGRTGRDGLRGATFSSLGMDEETTRVAGGAVQIGHPIAEKQVMEVLLRARDAGLYHAVTDCGAGGLSSAVGEMGREIGAVVELARVPLKYPGLDPWEVWLSEAQERMVLAVPAAAMGHLEALARAHASEVTAIGSFGGGRVRVTFEGEVVGDLDPEFLHEGLPRRHLKASWVAPAEEVASEDEGADQAGAIAAGLLARLGSANLGSRRAIVRRYDHEVGGGTVVRPLVGPGEGPSDAAVVVPREVRAAWLEAGGSGPLAGVAIGVGMDPELGLRDPYLMAWAAVDEAVRNVVAVGADPDAIAILDNFSWGDPRLPDRLGALVRCARGCHDAALHYGTPFVSGKDSLNNEWTDEHGRRHAIPPTLVITALGRVPDARRTATSALVAAGDVLYALGVCEAASTVLPDPDAPERYRALHRAIAGGLVESCHDVGGSGLAGALAEMAIGGRLGVDVVLARAPGASALRPSRRAFGTNPGRHLVAVAPAQVEAFEAAMAGQIWARIGAVTAGAEVALGDARVGLDEVEAAFTSEASSPF